MTGFVSCRSWPVADEQKRAKRFHAVWALTLCHTTQSGETEKKTCCWTSKHKSEVKPEIMLRLEVTLCQTHIHKELRETEII